ncbi:UDP-N-acetylmuramate dehydrogenase [Facklamia miroungae]|uniref:UDP-N-acetylenolpyruvoylglucosamine reductase n=1 Tax=Facklamia miroungae TaxID=120956 RepID=A0A1G7RI24_9LACT|nr:UDP-N-acetylmuramate dehydrogenase [Facklamia miroungae]NKZ29409.1 UDP-N-acetylmuramate dehydrogenase [Facklamia miroungae]SDG10294.1 UDP-N-acetylmuramate dehydrogenase [Facklamia miroungae]
MNLLEQFPSIKILKDEPLSKYTYTKTGGKADYLIFPQDRSQVEQIVNYARIELIPLTVLGNASNLIVKDGGIRGIVLMMTEMKAMRLINSQTLEAESGASLIQLTHLALKESLAGLEFACGIPGSIGGAVYMNAGAYGGEVKDVIDEVDVISREGQIRTFKNADCLFSYRHSIFQEQNDLILAVRFKLHMGEELKIKAEMDRLTKLRESKQPLEYPSCGSVFKRPEGYYTGQLIQEAGLQGHRIGGAEVSRKHAGFIVNIDHATATDYTDLIAYIQATIWEKNQVRLETEVRIIGENEI